ncbi:hypothetical protein VTO73DRAFT_7684 [Trametes versicolor]
MTPPRFRPRCSPRRPLSVRREHPGRRPARRNAARQGATRRGACDRRHGPLAGTPPVDDRYIRADGVHAKVHESLSGLCIAMASHRTCLQAWAARPQRACCNVAHRRLPRTQIGNTGQLAALRCFSSPSSPLSNSMQMKLPTRLWFI